MDKQSGTGEESLGWEMRYTNYEAIKIEEVSIWTKAPVFDHIIWNLEARVEASIWIKSSILISNNNLILQMYFKFNRNNFKEKLSR